MTNLDGILKSRDITLSTKVHLVKAMVFPVVMNGCESWTIKKAEHWIIDAFVLWYWRRLLKVPWTARRSNQFWIFIGRTDVEAETPILWPPDMKNWLIGKYPNAGQDWRQEEQGMTEDEMAGWHHWLDGRESEWTLAVGDGQGGLACCDSWCRKESDTTEQLIWSDLIWMLPWSFFHIHFVHISDYLIVTDTLNRNYYVWRMEIHFSNDKYIAFFTILSSSTKKSIYSLNCSNFLKRKRKNKPLSFTQLQVQVTVSPRSGGGGSFPGRGYVCADGFLHCVSTLLPRAHFLPVSQVDMESLHSPWWF